MMITRAKPDRCPHPRAGLAPLEFTLALPMLVFVMCLMINFGVIGAWKVRTQITTRYAGWGTVAERTGQFNPPPKNWPTNALWEEIDGTNLPQVDNLWNADPALLAPSIRGPQLTSPHGDTPVNVPGRLEMDDQVNRGHAVLDKPLPLLRGATSSGRFGFNLTQDLFDNRWQFFTLGIPSNESIRALIWYDISHSDLARLDPDIDQQWERVQQLAQQLQSNPQKCRLYPLDRDPEFQRYRGNWPDFYPRASGCSADVNNVARNIVGPLIGRINNVPCNVGRAFSGMYRSWICQLEACGYPDGEIQPLRDKYNALTGLNCGIGPLPMRCVCPPMGSCPCPPSPIADNCP